MSCSQRLGLCLLVVASAIGHMGCAHQSEARCAFRSPSPEHAPPGASAAEVDWYARRAVMLDHVRGLYEEGERSYTEPGREKGDSAFLTVVFDLTEPSNDEWGGEFLYEALQDGSWAYRCDEVTHIYAVAAYRLARVHADHPDQWRRASRARGYFCYALAARPELVSELVKKEGLTPTARRYLEEAKRNPLCYAPEGMRWKSSPASPPCNSPGC